MSTPKCHPRKRFATKEQASAAALHIGQSHGRRRLPEPCSYCNGWHLSVPQPK